MADQVYGGMVNGVPTFTNVGGFAEKQGLNAYDTYQQAGAANQLPGASSTSAANTVFGPAPVSPRAALSPTAPAAQPAENPLLSALRGAQRAPAETSRMTLNQILSAPQGFSAPAPTYAQPLTSASIQGSGEFSPLSFLDQLRK